MEQLEQMEQRDGNTNHPALSKRVVQSKYWFFTFNNFGAKEPEFLKETFDKICKKYVFQEEIGDNGTIHLQGSIELLKKMRWSEFGLSTEIHWEKTRNPKDANKYCQKKETATGRSWSKGMPKPLFFPCNEHNLKPWQQNLMDILKAEPDFRSIHWIYDPIGNTGKTQFARWYCHNNRALYCTGGIATDLYHLVGLYTEDLETLFFDIPREKKNNLSYQALESIKAGIICNTKYETFMKIMNPVHIIVFSNFLPDYSKLSLDRWKTYEIKLERLHVLEPVRCAVRALADSASLEESNLFDD